MRSRSKQPRIDVPCQEHANARQRHHSKDDGKSPMDPIQTKIHAQLSFAVQKEYISAVGVRQIKTTRKS